MSVAAGRVVRRQRDRHWLETLPGWRCWPWTWADLADEAISSPSCPDTGTRRPRRSCRRSTATRPRTRSGLSTRATPSFLTTAAPSRPSKPLLVTSNPYRRNGATCSSVECRKARHSPATLRKWERAGLVQPRRDPQTGYRVYSPADVRDALLAHQLRRGGYLLEQIAPLIAQVRSAGGIAPLESMLRDWRARLSARSRAMLSGAAALDAYLNCHRPRPKTSRAPAPPVRQTRIRFSRQVASADRRRRPSIGRRLPHSPLSGWNYERALYRRPRRVSITDTDNIIEPLARHDFETRPSAERRLRPPRRAAGR